MLFAEQPQAKASRLDISNVDDACLDPREDRTSGNFIDETNSFNAMSGHMRKLNCSECKYK
jgi:hypothetical protein